MNASSYLMSLNAIYPNIAYLYAALGYCFQAFLQIAFKYVTRVVPPFQALFLRGFCLFLLNTFIMRQAKETPYIADPLSTSLSIKSLGKC
jgi:hypothetical protein